MGTCEDCSGHEASNEGGLVKLDARQHSITKITPKNASTIDPRAGEFSIAEIAAEGCATPQLGFSQVSPSEVTFVQLSLHEPGPT